MMVAQTGVLAIKIEMQLNTGYLLKAELTGHADELNVGCEKKRGINDVIQVFGQ